MDLNNHLDTLLWRLPPFPHKRIIKLLRRGILPCRTFVLCIGNRGLRTGNGGRLSVGGEVKYLVHSTGGGGYAEGDGIEGIESGWRGFLVVDGAFGGWRDERGGGGGVGHGTGRRWAARGGGDRGVRERERRGIGLGEGSRSGRADVPPHAGD